MNTFVTIFFGLLLVLTTRSVAYSQNDIDALLSRMLDAYGGEEQLEDIQSLEFETVGYFHGRNQSRRTEPPWDRIPVRQFTAIEFPSERAARDVLSAWPGGLSMGRREISNGENSWTLNTISRFYEASDASGYRYALNSVNTRFPGLFVRFLDDNRDRISDIDTEMRDGIHYISFLYGERTIVLVHPETFLISTMEYDGIDHMSGRTVSYQREYQDYYLYEGMMVPGRFLMWVDGLPYFDLNISHLAFNVNIEAYLEIPDTFVEIESSAGYSGQSEIDVRRIADGVYAAGDGEIQILYVEFDDYWVAMETGNFPSYAEATHQMMMPHMNGKPLRYIVPTHYHDDHLIGIHYYARIGATILTTRDKEAYIRQMLDRSHGDHGPVQNASFEYIEGDLFQIADETNRMDIHVYADAPHTENMLVAYVHGSEILFSGDTVIGWVQPDRGHVRQGAPFAAVHMDNWVREQQAAGRMGSIREYVNVHGLAYSPEEWRQMLSTERTFVTLPDNAALPVLSWFLDYGLSDETVHNPRRDYLPTIPTTH